MPDDTTLPHTPVLRDLGEDGVLVDFADRLSDPANIAAIAFAAAVAGAAPAWVVERSTALKSLYVRFDPDRITRDGAREWLGELIASRDWYGAGLPSGRRLHRIPVAFGGENGPQLDEVADLVGVSEGGVIETLTTTRLRVLAMGFAPGMPYLGMLPEAWDIPRQSALTPSVPDGAIVVAVRQVVAFAVQAQTGWRQVGRGAYRCFDPARTPEFLFAAGDEVALEPVSAPELIRLREGAMTPPAPDVIA